LDAQRLAKFLVHPADWSCRPNLCLVVRAEVEQIAVLPLALELELVVVLLAPRSSVRASKPVPEPVLVLPVVHQDFSISSFR
jgi:hypothetical protein